MSVLVRLEVSGLGEGLQAEAAGVGLLARVHQIVCLQVSRLREALAALEALVLLCPRPSRPRLARGSARFYPLTALAPVARALGRRAAIDATLAAPSSASTRGGAGGAPDEVHQRGQGDRAARLLLHVDIEEQLEPPGDVRIRLGGRNLGPRAL